MGGKSKAHKEMEKQMVQAKAERDMAVAAVKEPSEFEKRHTEKASNWDSWIAGKNYGQPPEGELLNMNLLSQDHINKMRARLANIRGVGAMGLTGTMGDESGQLARSKMHLDAEIAQRAAGDYEQAVTATDAYYKGMDLPYANLVQQRGMGLLGSATNQQQFATQGFVNTAPQPIFGQILGAAAGVAGAYLGRPRK